jgi:hypothetical protein
MTIEESKQKIEYDLSNHAYFSIKIHMLDEASYERVISYTKEKAKRDKDEKYIFRSGGYVLDDAKKEIVRPSPSRKNIELTKEVNEEFRKRIEDIIAGY